MVVILYNECYYFFISIVKFKQFDLSKSENCIVFFLDGGSTHARQPSLTELR